MTATIYQRKIPPQSKVVPYLKSVDQSLWTSTCIPFIAFSVTKDSETSHEGVFHIWPHRNMGFLALSILG